LRIAGLVKKLNDYQWSSYLYYAYVKNAPVWLQTDFILSQMHGDARRKLYRKKTQQYAKEEGSVWEDVKHGLIYGSQNFVKKMRDQYLFLKKNEELPQHNSMFSDVAHEDIVSRSARILDFDIEKARHTKRMVSEEKDKRDFIMYLLWESGGLPNQKIGSVFNLTYSSVSRRVSDIRNRLTTDKNLQKHYQELKSKIKV
jgi:putative transposase